MTRRGDRLEAVISDIGYRYDTPSFKDLQDWYTASFHDLPNLFDPEMEFPPWIFEPEPEPVEDEPFDTRIYIEGL